MHASYRQGSVVDLHTVFLTSVPTPRLIKPSYTESVCVPHSSFLCSSLWSYVLYAIISILTLRNTVLTNVSPSEVAICCSHYIRTRRRVITKKPIQSHILYSPGWPQTHCVAEAGLSLLRLLSLLGSSSSTETMSTCHHTQRITELCY